MSDAASDIGDLLMEAGMVTAKELNYAKHEAIITGLSVGDALIKFGFASRGDVAKLNAGLLGIEYVEPENLLPDEEVLRHFNFNYCARNNFMPLTRRGNSLVVATSSHDLAEVKEIIMRKLETPITLLFCDRKSIQKQLYHFYFALDNPIEEVVAKEMANVMQDESMSRTLDDLLNNIIHLAVKKRTTDIHIRPMEDSINLAFRVDGVLHSQFSMDKKLIRLISTIKLRASMDIAEFRLPQDGGFSIKLSEDTYDLRISTIVCSFGENVVMRILPRDNDIKRLEELGFEKDHLAMINDIFEKPYGIFLITGPTGSGKTTTLHAGLRNIDMLDNNVVTVEDPIEYRIPVARQTQVNDLAGYTFSSAIRHFLRHDPDVILVGEIRDAETAKTAITAAETGHLVLSTLHTNSVMGVIPRLTSLGVPLHMITDSLIGCLSQRLIRRNCPSCSVMENPTEIEMEYLDIPADHQLLKGKGCEHCSETGFYGRDTLYEILPVSTELLSAYEKEESLDEIHEKALAAGMVISYEVAKMKVLANNTAVSQVINLAPKPAK
jgi:type II secretory ATPase GspE/PulE/Tfp pilus assembly ATPase PilB-like protein